MWLEGNLETKSFEDELTDVTGRSSVWVNEQGFKVKLQFRNSGAILQAAERLVKHLL